MSEPADKIDRILVALDTQLRNLGMLKAAAELAASRQAELLAIFIEDVNLVKLADLPLAREIDRASAETRAFDSAEMCAALRAQASQVERMLDKIARDLHLRSSLRVVRGHYVSEALAAAGAMDVLFLRSVAEHVMHTRERQASLWTVYDGSSAAERALRVAVDLARTDGDRLVVLLPYDSPAVAEDLQRRTASRLRDAAAGVSYRMIPAGDFSGVLQALRASTCRLLVLYRDAVRHPDEALQRVLESLNCPVVLVP